MLAARTIAVILFAVTALVVSPIGDAAECIGAGGGGVRTGSGCAGVSNQVQDSGGPDTEVTVTLDLERRTVVVDGGFRSVLA